MSFMNTMTNMLRHSFDIRFINSMNTVGSVSETKRHHHKLIVVILCSECGLRHIFFFNLNLMYPD